MMTFDRISRGPKLADLFNVLKSSADQLALILRSRIARNAWGNMGNSGAFFPGTPEEKKPAGISVHQTADRKEQKKAGDQTDYILSKILI